MCAQKLYDDVQEYVHSFYGIARRGRVPYELRELTEEEGERVEEELFELPDSENERLIDDRFDTHVTVKNLKTLKPGEWLDDEVINNALGMMSLQDNSVFVASTLFYAKLLQVDDKFEMGDYNFDGVRRWYTNVEFRTKHLLLFPIHIHGNHWVLVAVDRLQMTMGYYDSLGGTNEEALIHLTNIRRYMNDRGIDNRVYHFELSPNCVPRQANASDCGAFLLLFAHVMIRKGTQYCYGKQPDFDHFDIPLFRDHLALSIMTKRLTF